MKRFLTFCLTGLLIAVNAGCQTPPDSGFNFDFEKVSDGMPEQWSSFGSDGYTLGIDSLSPHQGRYAASIVSLADSTADFKAWALQIPGSYEGKLITLTGYLKTEDVTDGFAGLWMRIDPNVAFDNMQNRGVAGTTEWTQYSITLPMRPAQTTQIVVGGLLVGKGKMWIDDLKVTIDGKDIRLLQPMGPKEYPAQKDKEFDAGSGITAIPVDAANIEAMKQLGLIWGFLKYYHPAVAEGNFNWDYELFRILPKILNEKKQVNRDRMIMEWIGGLGAVTEAAPAAEIKDAKLLPDLGWIDDSGFSKELVATLKKVRDAQRPETSYYIGLFPGVGNPEFKNENPYAAMKYPDAGYRILALFRYWNMMQYYNPNRHLIEADWKKVLGEFIPRFVEAGNETEYVLTTLELIARVHDTHANLWMRSPVLDTFKGKYLASPIVTFVGEKAVVTGFRKGDSVEQTGLKTGDVIAEIDGRKVEEIIREKLKTTPASNYPTQLRDIARDLLHANAAGIKVVYSRNGQSAPATLKCYTEGELDPYYYPQPESSFRIIDDNIAYLFPGLLRQGEGVELWPKIKYAKGLIVDLRCYPTDFIVYSFIPMLLPKATPFVKFSKGSVATPGLFTITEPLVLGKDNPDHYQGKIVVLINEITQSQAEYTTMALRAFPGTTVIGSTTAGADGNVSEILLPGGLRSLISGIGIYYPDGRETQRIGIVPDIVSEPTIEGIAAGRDEMLEKAVSLIK